MSNSSFKHLFPEGVSNIVITELSDPKPTHLPDGVVTTVAYVTFIWNGPAQHYQYRIAKDEMGRYKLLWPTQQVVKPGEKTRHYDVIRGAGDARQQIEKVWEDAIVAEYKRMAAKPKATIQPVKESTTPELEGNRVSFEADTAQLKKIKDIMSSMGIKYNKKSRADFMRAVISSL